MKTTVAALCCLTGIIVALAAGSAGGDKAAAPTPGLPSVGVVNIREILRQDKTFADEFASDQSKARTELGALAKEIHTEEGDLATLRSSSTDYLKQMEAVAEKKARFSAREEFLKQRALLKQQLWSQKMHADIVRATREVAVEKGLSLVLVKEDPDTPQPEEMSTRIVTQKVLYSDGCWDVTADVQARLSAVRR